MRLLHGVSAPPGNGTVLEVHLDIQNASPAFASWLEGIGFENDPFVLFYPPEYSWHMTGRTRIPPKGLHDVFPKIDSLVEDVIAEARLQAIRLYSEIELVRGTTYFASRGPSQDLVVLDSVTLRGTGQFGGAKADVHVEFESGRVPGEVRDYLSRNHFYWVSTPPTTHFPAEEIATLQTSTYPGAKEIYDLLVATPLPGCTGIHIEQKLSMKVSTAGLPMPEVIEVKAAT